MTKIVSLLALMMIVSLGYGQSVEYTDGKVLSWYAPNTGSYDCKIKIKNIKGQEVILKYAKVSSDFPSGWDVTLCDNFNCFTQLVDTGSFYPMKDMEYGEMKVTIDAKGVADTAYIKYAIWDKENPSLIDTIDYTIYVNFGANANTLANSDIAIYPNPAKDVVNISASEGSIASLYSSNGQLLISETLANKVEQLDVSGMKAGLYVLTLLDSKGIRSSQLIIE